MSASAIFGLKMAVLPRSSTVSTTGFYGGASKLEAAPKSVGGLAIECSSRPQKKATAHHKKTRPRKTQAWDIRRGPAVYPPLPTLPPEWSFATDESGQPASAGASEPKTE
ncbi:PREDICTED: 50S ribosomal protein 6, chloroplastic [Nicotiana attenuata]|uniref:50s ribosomal protein 6, chloroplastic n=1 Tax=Nicotiana attenuata TaxID=49451 RepID=A0A314L3T2_NICAT|nr:PREDICTED: 50S ribosomal protein 6, chloroplastic [Nicotiana attenuata]OIT36361.1 50s ribosomal protein 6, chloroplastic [Nicotiana attenuata]